MTTSFAHDNSALAALYDRISDQQFESGKRLVERLGVTEVARVLDVGCGTGRLAHWIAERVGSGGFVAGIDPLEERIRIARSHGGAARFEVGQAEDLGAFADASFDIVCMSSVFHWISDKGKALAEVRRVLRPGGRVGMTTLPLELARAGTVGLALATLLARPPYAGHVDFPSLTFAGRGCASSELVALALEHRLDLLDLHIAQRSRTYASGEAFVDFLEASSFGNFLTPVPEALRPSLRADLISALDAQRGPEGVVVRGWGLLLIAARA